MFTRADPCGYAQADDSEGSVKDVLRPGSELQVAGYCMYGSSANLVISTGQGVNGYTLDNVSLLFGQRAFLRTL
jgi:fructose-1,6-bisphosphatase